MILQKHIVFTFLLGHIHNFSILRSKKYFWDLFFLKIKIVPKTETEKYILEKDVNMYLIFFSQVNATHLRTLLLTVKNKETFLFNQIKMFTKEQKEKTDSDLN